MHLGRAARDLEASKSTFAESISGTLPVALHHATKTSERCDRRTHHGFHDAEHSWRDRRTTVASAGREAILGTANMYANRAGPGGHVASASFMVASSARGHGIGRALVLDALAWARAAGFRAMQFNAVAATNTAAVALYESLGFSIVGTVPEAFDHPEHGLVGLHVMHRRLGAEPR
jgi:GNAT superfamily N-acetyltransferase